MRLRFRRRKQHGLVLLVVLSLLVLFMLILTTFLITSNQFRKAAVAQAQHEVAGDPPEVQLDRAMLQLLRDTRVDLPSSIRGHSLLADLYGANQGAPVSERVRAQISAVAGAGNGQFLNLGLTTGGLSPRPNYYAGRVLTFITGTAKGTSTRVLAYRPAAGGTPATFTVLAPKALEASVPAIPVVNDVVLINGAPFNGSGVGLNPAGGAGGPTLDLQVTLPESGAQLEMALLPHFSTYLLSGGTPNGGGEDESYDAADYQNMFLAMIRHQQPVGGTGFEDTTPVVTAPSFHRPSLINYWMNNTNTMSHWTVGSTSAANREVRRAAVLRPMPWDHPNFTGSNPAFAGPDSATLQSALRNGPWDVDNDRDGVTDSIWIDVGFPVQTNAKGQVYKPLVAILVKEMDSRLNVNAHSTIAQATSGVFDVAQTSRNTTLQPSSGDQMAGIMSGGNFTLPRGNGYSPAEIYLRGLFANLNEYQNVVAGRYDTTGASPPSTTPIPSPGRAGTDDPLSRLITTQFPQASGGIYQQAPTPVLSGYGSPPFNYGVRSMALDWSGNPFYPQPTPASQIVDDPHELDLMTRRARDAGILRGTVDDRDRPYTHAELERLLRFRDADAPSLPDRLLRLAPNTFNVSSSRARDLTTTDSRYIPVPLASYGREDYTGAGSGTLTAGKPVTAIDVLAFRLQKGGVSATEINAQLERMLPLELFRGQRFDINRLFGNGRDDNGNGVVDEPREVLEGVEAQAWNAFTSQFAGFNSAGFSHRNNDVVAGTNVRVNPRQIFARQLYCLMMLMIDQGFQFPATEPGLTATELTELRARRVAQWAVNVVDARDPDAIMTPFEYDVNPFDGWETYITGDLQDNIAPGSVAAQPQRRLVWGAEAPDVLLTESLAFHDRRVRDTDWEDNGGMMGQLRGTAAMAMRDDDLDQLRKPEGSLFLELQCVRNRYTNNHGILPRELYVNGLLDMSKMAPGTFAGWSSPGSRAHPVWQVSISAMHRAGTPERDRFSALVRSAANPDTCSFDPLDMSLLQGAPDEVDIERTIWFTRQTPLGYPGIENSCFYNQAATDIRLRPGQFLVVGPRRTTYAGSVETNATDTTLALVPSNQRIVLGTGVAVFDPANNLLTPNATSIQPVVSMIAKTRELTPTGWANTARAELNISEPLPRSPEYYLEPAYATQGVPAPAPPEQPRTESYRDIVNGTGDIPDVPLDALPGTPINQMQQTGTYDDVRTVFLQRLADPTVPFHAVLNPYISVDWSTVDLTVFNGDDRLNSGDFDPQGGMQNTAPDEKFSTRQRGVNSNTLWSPITQLPANTPNTTETVYLKEELRETLGYVNDINPRDATIDHFVQGEVPNEYIGAPKRTTPWISWYNRPYESPYELLQVPTSSASRLGFEYTDASDVDTGSSNPYNTNPGPSTPANNPAYLPFSHLTNFLQTSPFPVSGTPALAPHFYRLFDYVETPSPFVGTRQYFNPSTGTTLDTYRPPYNYISRFRDPGRVNINMVYDKAIFDGVLAGAAGNQTQKDALWNQVQLSRRGFAVATGDTHAYVPEAAFPTLFANPFRAAGAARLTPLPGQPGMEHREVDVTLLRPSPSDPRFPLFHVASTARHNNTTNNSHFRYQGLSRLGNLLSTTSNVFGVWMTIGYFEVTETARNAAHPDGYQLGIEVGSDTGEVERHRAFYLIDRSIPVGFEPGFNHNVQKAILIKRFIE